MHKDSKTAHSALEARAALNNYADTLEGGSELILRIKDLRQTDDDTFILKNVRIAQPDYHTVHLTLTQAGVDEQDATRLVDEFAETVFQFQLGKELAKRAQIV